MRVPISVIDVFAIAFMNTTLPFHVATRLISRRSPLLLFLSTAVLSILFVVISAHEAH
jgi:hypothetical protein